MTQRIDQLTEKYIKLRDMKKELADKQKEEMSYINEGMGRIEGLVMKELLDQGVDSMKTKYGTPYISRRRSYKVVDFSELLPIMMEHPDLIVRRVSTEVADEIVESSGTSLPGTELVVERKVNFKR